MCVLSAGAGCFQPSGLNPDHTTLVSQESHPGDRLCLLPPRRWKSQLGKSTGGKDIDGRWKSVLFFASLSLPLSIEDGELLSF